MTTLISAIPNCINTVDVPGAVIDAKDITHFLFIKYPLQYWYPEVRIVLDNPDTILVVVIEKHSKIKNSNVERRLLARLKASGVPKNKLQSIRFRTFFKVCDKWTESEQFEIKKVFIDEYNKILSNFIK